ncbi:hypothetical protein TSOC_009146 [Tetrabaena socialis]|uniref:Uncharacterized protein n=1 Tax=Tetrabaena socialis TaxID=47790 RepID=A0A2J7ZWK2_9CHLO|nr:hypothetical protein TSOC_009146 [Tetrabaena socialis]|eukprot:PNH04657.1 hypothetical protein TSOC_009146 [Tetrabaena socialis]
MLLCYSDSPKPLRLASPRFAMLMLFDGIAVRRHSFVANVAVRRRSFVSNGLSAKRGAHNGAGPRAHITP